MTQRRRRAGPWAAAAAVGTYAWSLTFGFTDLDDRDLIVDDQPFLQSASSLWRVFERSYMHVLDARHAYYRPVVSLSYALDARWSGVHPQGFHATNVALHAAASWLVALLLERVVGDERLALLGALVFAVHPALAPAVAWIPGRNDLLLAVFALTAWLALLRGASTVHLLAFAAALLSKETAAALPLVWALHLGLEPAARPRGLARFALPGAWAALVTARVLAHPALGAVSPGGFARLVRGLGELALPVHLSPLAVDADVPTWPGFLGFAGILVATRWLGAVRRRVIALGLGAFALTYLPGALVPGVLEVGSRLYLPAVGFVLVLAELLRGAALEPRALLTTRAATVCLGLLTLAFESSFRNARAFASDAVDGSPRSALAHFCLGSAAQRQGDDAVATREYRTALTLGPVEGAHNNLAVLAMRDARWMDAERELREELALHPRYGRALVNLAIVLRREDRPDDACRAAQASLEIAPDDLRGREERTRSCTEGP